MIVEPTDVEVKRACGMQDGLETRRLGNLVKSVRLSNVWDNDNL